MKYVCFDLGGVVVRICRSWSEASLRAGLDVRSLDMDRLIAEEKLADRLFGGDLSTAGFAEAVSEAVQGLYSPDEVVRVHEAVVIEPFPEILALIHRVKSAGLSPVVLSNTMEEHWQLIRAFPAVQLMDQCFLSHRLKLIKPDAAIYKKVESELSCLGSDILFFDDLVENIEAAKRVGWSAKWIDPSLAPEPQMHVELDRVLVG